MALAKLRSSKASGSGTIGEQHCSSPHTGFTIAYNSDISMCTYSVKNMQIAFLVSGNCSCVLSLNTVMGSKLVQDKLEPYRMLAGRLSLLSIPPIP